MANRSNRSPRPLPARDNASRRSRNRPMATPEPSARSSQPLVRPSVPKLLPDRGVVGAQADPTGDTAIDGTRLSVRSAVDGLVADARRESQWHDIIEHTHKLLDNIGLTYRQPALAADRWRTQRDPFLVAIGDLARNLNSIHATQARAFKRLALDLQCANTHFAQPVRRLAMARRRFADPRPADYHAPGFE